MDGWMDVLFTHVVADNAFILKTALRLLEASVLKTSKVSLKREIEAM